LIISLQGTTLRKEACHFFLHGSKKSSQEIFQRINDLKRILIQETLAYEKTVPMDSISKILRKAVKTPF
jgi:hypothetical protein